VDGQMQVESAQTDSAKQKKVARAVVGVSAPAGTSPLVKHKTVKHAAGHKAASGSSKETRRSIWDVMGHLFSRLFLVFIVGAGLGTTVWSLRATSPKSIHRSSALEIEQLQEFVTKSVRGMQVSASPFA